VPQVLWPVRKANLPARFSLMNPPRGYLVTPSRGKSPLVPSISEGWVSAKVGIRSHLDFGSPPCFSILPLCSGSQKLLRGCLTYSRQLYLSREYLYILWPESAIGTELRKSCGFGRRATSQTSTLVLFPSELGYSKPGLERDQDGSAASGRPGLGVRTRPVAAARCRGMPAKAHKCLQRGGAG
jgi:hypothetical protein